MKRKLLLSLWLFFSLCVTSVAQRIVTGTVTSSEDGATVPGVNVIEKGTANGTTTDLDGKFRLSISESNSVLVFSFIGLATKEVTVGNQSAFDVAMDADVTELQELVVTAFGVERDKNKLGYSAQEVQTDQLTNSGEANLVNALNGRVAGVQITNSSGAPGASANIIIRGASSISGNNQPLFVIDGIPIDNTTDASDADGVVNGAGDDDYGQTIGTNRASDLNPADIESVTVLKGGAATALYGLRAVNGAIIITTKSGKGSAGGLNVNFSTGYSVERANKFPEFQQSFARGRNGAYSNVTHWSWGPAYAANPVFPSDDPSTPAVDESTITDIDGDGTLDNVSGQAIPFFGDNYENFWQDGSTYTANLSVSGSGENSNFYASFGYTDQEGIIPNSQYEKYNFTIKGSYDVTDKLTIGGFSSYINTKRVAHQGTDTGFGQGLGYWHHMWDITDDRPWIDDQGNRTWFSNFVPDPRWIAYEEAEESNVDRVISNFNMSYEFAPWIKLSYRVGIDTYTDRKDLLRPITSPNSTNREGDFYEITATSRDVTSNMILSGNFSLTDDLKMSYLVGNDFYQKNYDRLYVFGEALSIQGFRDISNLSRLQSTNRTERKRIVGAFGEIAFDFKNALFLSITGRNDWSSTLPPENNSFFYPSVNLGYVFTETTGNIGPISFGKVKASWAQLGNDAPVYLTATPFANDLNESPTGGTNVNIGGPPRFSVSATQGFDELVPELSTAVEAGIELRGFNDLIGLDLTFYQRNTDDQILLVPLSSSTGYTAVAQNAGEVRNRGFEAVISYNDILRSVTPKVQWSGFINLYANENEVLSVPDGLEEIVVGFSYWNESTIVARPGLPYGSYVGPGFKRNDNGVLLLDDNGYPQLADENLVLGDPNPDWIMNINNSVSFAGFKLDATLEIRQGGEVLNDAEAFWVYSGLSKTTENRFIAADNPHANATRVFDGIIESTGEQSTIAAPLDNDYYHNLNSFVDESHIEDASWVRLRTVSLTYSLPNQILGKFFKGVDVSVIGRNLWLKTDYSGVDPETNAFGAGNVQGIDLIGAPNTKSLGVRFNARF
ncbi:MAG: SusC/RagA family TonB-linked outer membrane protein [Cyclobacteriaceae bacterium]|nr:SusC/RagA family TonB-linked outer membrane protein [Cyclobacteriaceae bacterium HetDA_MAG_MS6]